MNNHHLYYSWHLHPVTILHLLLLLLYHYYVILILPKDHRFEYKTHHFSIESHISFQTTHLHDFFCPGPLIPPSLLLGFHMGRLTVWLGQQLI